MRLIQHPFLALSLSASFALLGCSDDLPSADSDASEETDGDPTGDGDGDPTGEGDGDGDGDPAGDGDGDPAGDGDGDPTGDGDGDGDPGDPLGEFLLIDMPEATAISANGEHVLLFHGFSAQGDVGIWTEPEGLTMIEPTGNPVHYPWAISNDGTRVAGAAGDISGGHAAMWNEGVGWEDLGSLGSCGESGHGHAWDMTPDGDAIVGLAWDGCEPTAFRWTEDEGFEALELLGDGSNRASAISDDGSLIAGFGDAGAFINRSPTLWHEDGTGEFLDLDVGEVRGLNSDGSVRTGEFNFGDAFVWTEDEQFINIGRIPEGESYAATGLAVCADGAYVVGLTGIPGPGASHAFVWTPARGMELLEDRLTGLGVEIPAKVSKIFSSLDCSADGTRVVGAAMVDNNSAYQAYVLTMPDQWWDLP